MNLILDSSGANAMLFGGNGAEIVSAALLKNEARVFIHLTFLTLHPERRGKTSADGPDLTGLNMLDPTIYDAQAGNVEGADALTRLEDIGERR